MTSAKIECPSCHRTYDVAEKVLGKKVICANKACGAKFLAELREPPRPIETPSFNPSEAELLSDADFVQEPPPLRRPAAKTYPKRIIAIASAAMLLSVMGVAIVFFACQATNLDGSGTKPGANTPVEGAQSGATANQIAELLYRTEVTLRMLKISDDANLAREYIDTWVVLRGAIPKSDNTEVSLDVIEGHLNSIHETLYPRTGDSRDNGSSLGWRDATEWSNHRKSVDAIRSAQGQLMKLVKIRWNEVNRSGQYSGTFAKLRDEGRRVASISNVDKSNLPQPLTADEAIKLMRSLDILYADVPVDARDLSPSRNKDDAYGIPARLEIFEDNTIAQSIHRAAANVIYARSHMSVSQDTLKHKTESLEFSVRYSKDLEHLLTTSR